MFYGIVGVLKGVPKNFTNFSGKYLYRIKSEPKILIYQCSLHLYYKRHIPVKYSWKDIIILMINV